MFFFFVVFVYFKVKVDKAQLEVNKHQSEFDSAVVKALTAIYEKIGTTTGDEEIFPGGFDDLEHGVYRVNWVDGGMSLAAVGSFHDGRRWLSPTNWTTADGATQWGGKEVWGMVKSLILIETHNYS